MIVKVCGVRTPQIAEAAIDAGADWLGLVFEPRSPRFVGDSEARAVQAAAGARAELIGVFVSPSPGACEEAADRYGLAAVQVHGDVSAEFVTGCSVPVIRGVNVASQQEAYAIQWWPDLLVLLDAPTALLPGGTGARVPIEFAAQVARHRRIVLAGGLGPDNVAAAVRAARPEGVDASSGLESAPGVKEAPLVEAFVRNARAAFAETAAA
ncbi:MAG: phosphoribosylanthranilate isomerase [Candidatus Dormibacteraeota bacterium]|nr:phosphoribosylanthranilate isomerase [Candidatus Dormibacteraeota bacterium]